MLQWIKTVIRTLGYPGIAGLMILENVFPPIPSEVIIPFSGFFSEDSGLSLPGIVLAGSIGSVLGTLPFYFLGYKIGEAKLNTWIDRYGHWFMITTDDIRRSQSWFERYDLFAVFLGRLVPGVRTLISIPAGIERMNLGLFLLLSLAGTGVWVGVLAYLGNMLGQHYTKVEQYLGPVSYVIIGGLILWYIRHVVKRYKA